MRDDLLDAQAAVDWAVAQFPSLQQRIDAWIELNVEVVVEDPDPSGPNNVVVAVDPQFYRPTEVDQLVGDPTKARDALGWQPQTSFDQLVELMVQADLDRLR